MIGLHPKDLENPLEKDPFSKSLERLWTAFIGTNVLPWESLMAKGLPWRSLRVLRLTLCPAEEADELLLPAPAANARTSIESDDKFRSDESGSAGSDDINSQIQCQTALFISHKSQRRIAAWYLDWSNHNTIKLKSLRDKLGKWSDWQTDVRDKWSLWNLSDAFKLKTGTIHMKVRYLTWWYTLRSASKVPILGSKGSESKQIDVTNEWIKKRQWKSKGSAGEMLQANRMKLTRRMQIERKPSN